MFHGQTGLNHSRPKRKRLERLTSANGCLVVFLQYFINPVTNNNRKEKNPKGLGDLANLVPLCGWLQPFPHHLCCAKGWPLSPLAPSHSQAVPIENLEAAGAPVQRLLINVSLSANMHVSFTFKYCIAARKTRDAGWGKHWVPLWQCLPESCLCEVCQQQPCEDSRAFSFLWGLVHRFSWENWPLSPPPVWCPLSLGDSWGILHCVRRYYLPIQWICWNVSGRTAEAIFFFSVRCALCGRTSTRAMHTNVKTWAWKKRLGCWMTS